MPALLLGIWAIAFDVRLSVASVSYVALLLLNLGFHCVGCMLVAFSKALRKLLLLEFQFFILRVFLLLRFDGLDDCVVGVDVVCVLLLPFQEFFVGGSHLSKRCG